MKSSALTMQRRGFLSALIAGGLSAAVDPERLLWTPGEKLISIPKHRPVITPLNVHLFCKVGDILTFAGFPGRYLVTDTCVGKVQMIRAL